MSNLEAITREEKYLGHMAGICGSMPEPVTREERFIAELCRCIHREMQYPKDEEGNVDYGEAGQFLMSNGDGSTEWTDMPCAAVWKASLIGILEENMAEPLLPNNLTELKSLAFHYNRIIAFTELPDSIKILGASVFKGCSSLALTKLPASLEEIGGNCFANCTGLTEITFQSTPNIANNSFDGCVNLTTINVPWTEGEVEGSPWGAVNATINYNA